jgi:cytochrome c oxidase subunit II
MLNSLLPLMAQAANAKTDPDADPSAADLDWGGTFSFPEQASSFAERVDNLYMAIFWISAFFFVLIVAVMVGFCIVYRRRPERPDPEKSPSHNTTLELLWSIIPSFLLIWIFVEGASGWFEMNTPVDNSYEIDVEARQFGWTFTYPNGTVTNNLHLSLNQPVRLRFKSADVIHAFFVPAFRQKVDVVPGRYTFAWVKPTLEGKYRLYCAEYCGQQHSDMRRTVFVYRDSWDEVMKKIEWDYQGKAQTEEGRLENGQKLYQIHCSGCHSNDGTTKTGPSFYHIWGETHSFENTSETDVVDDNYIRESLLLPQAKIREGFGGATQMPTFQGKLSDDQIAWLITYIRSLGE